MASNRIPEMQISLKP